MEILTPRNAKGQFIKGFATIPKGTKRPEMTGSKHPLWGKQHSEETRQKMRVTNQHPSHRKGIVISIEYGQEKAQAIKEKIVKGQRQVWQNSDYRERQREIRRNQKHTQTQVEALQRSSRAFWSQATNREKQSQRLKELWQDAAYRAKAVSRTREAAGKISQSIKKLWAEGYYEGCPWRSPLMTTRPDYFTSLEQLIRLFLEERGLHENKDWFHNERVSKYYPDFLLPNFHLIIEADGSWVRRKAREAERDSVLKSKGFTILHFNTEAIRTGRFQTVLDAHIEKTA